MCDISISQFLANVRTLFDACPTPVHSLQLTARLLYAHMIRFIGEMAAEDLRCLVDLVVDIDFPLLAQMLSKCTQLRSLPLTQGGQA